MTIETRTEQLLTLVANDRDTRRDAILADARARTAALRAEAHRKARAQVSEAFLDERRRSTERIESARARLQSQRRAATQDRARALLDAAWQRLRPALCARWQDPTQRKAWVAHLLAEAQRRLTPGMWHITYAAGWPDAEQRAAATALREIGVRIQLEVDPAIKAGMRIRDGGNVIDGTVDGLLDDHAEIGARLLVALEDAV